MFLAQATRLIYFNKLNDHKNTKAAKPKGTTKQTCNQIFL